VGIKIPLDIESIASRDNWRDGQEENTTLVLNKRKRDYLNKEDLGLSRNPRSKNKGKMP